MLARTTEAPVLLIGAAHVVDLADPLRRVLSGRPLDGIAVELDPERAATLFDPPEHRGRSTGAPLFARLWAIVQRRLGAEIGGGPPGSEMRAAAVYAREQGLPLFLIDDPLRATLGELVRRMPLRERVSLLASAFVGLVLPARVVEREMDRYAESPTEYAEELRQASPTIARVLLDDRNEHMAERLAVLRQRGYGRIAAVVGDAHVPGLKAALGRRGVPSEAVTFRELRRTPATVPGPRPS